MIGTIVHCLGIWALPDDAPERATPWAPHVNNAEGDEARCCVDALIATLEREPLDPSFEEYGCFWEPEGGGVVGIWGNFANLSAVFRISSNDPEVLDRLGEAIRANRKRGDYRAARMAEQRRQNERRSRGGGPRGIRR